LIRLLLAENRAVQAQAIPPEAPLPGLAFLPQPHRLRERTRFYKPFELGYGNRQIPRRVGRAQKPWLYRHPPRSIRSASARNSSSVMALARRVDLSRVLRQRLELPGHGAVMPLAAVLEGIRQPVFSRRPLLDQPHHHGAAVCPALGVGFPFRFGHGPTPTRYAPIPPLKAA